MRNAIFTTVCLILLSAVWLAAQDRLYVVQALDESLGRIEVPGGQVNAHVLNLGYGCNDIIAYGNRLYVTNSLLNTVQEIDALTDRTLRDIPVTGGVNPYSMAIVSGDTLAVTNWVTDNVSLIRLSTGETVLSMNVGRAPEGIITYENRLFVCLTRFLEFGSFGPGAVMVYDRQSLAFVDSLSVGTNPQFAAVDDLGRLHVVCTGNYNDIGGQVDIFDAVTLDFVATLTVGGTPSNVSFGGGFACLAAGGWGDEGYVYRYRLNDLMIVNDVHNPLTTRPGATDIEAMPDGSFYVSCFNDDVVEWRSRVGELLATFLVSDGPGQLVMFRGPRSQPEPRSSYAPPEAGLEAYPNPFNSSVRLRIGRDIITPQIINIYNVIGARVGHIDVPVGIDEVTWMPSTEHGSFLGSGFYVAMLGGEKKESCVKIMYVR